MNYIHILQQLGCSEMQARIYLLLLESDPLLVTDISRKLATHRQNIYLALPFLCEQNFVQSLQIGKRTYFTALPPESLISRIESLQHEMNTGLHILQEKFREKSPAEIRYFQGEKGIGDVFDDIARTLRPDELYYRYTARKRGEGHKEYAGKYYEKIRNTRGIQRMIIANEKHYSAKETIPRLDRDIVYIPEDLHLFDDNVGKCIYGNKVAYIDYLSLQAYVIQNERLYDFEKSVFLTLFQFLRDFNTHKKVPK